MLNLFSCTLGLPKSRLNEPATQMIIDKGLLIKGKRKMYSKSSNNQSSIINNRFDYLSEPSTSFTSHNRPGPLLEVLRRLGLGGVNSSLAPAPAMD